MDIKEIAALAQQNKKLIYALHVIVWLVIAVVFTSVSGALYSASTTFVRTFSNVATLAIIFYVNIYLVNRFVESKQYLHYLFWAVLLFWVTSLGRGWVNSCFPIDFYEPLLNHENRIYLFTMVTSLGAILFSMIYQMLQNKHAAEKKMLKAINQYQEAQLQFLKAQINPHFLFNTLNNIYSLAIIKSDDTPKMILKLSELLRYVIYQGQANTVLIENEIKHISDFIDLYQMKSENPLNITFQYDNLADNLLIEPMILIPLVENCFKHSDIETNPNGFIQLNLIYEQQQLIFTANNSKSNQAVKDKVGGVGLVNIKKRLEMSHPSSFELVQKETNSTFHVTLRISYAKD